MLLQASPLDPQISHWYWKVIGLDPFHVPGLAVSLLPTAASPLIVGNVSFVGATALREDEPSATAATTSAASDATATTGVHRPERKT
jgi:hypothetical protein